MPLLQAERKTNGDSSPPGLGNCDRTTKGEAASPGLPPYCDRTTKGDSGLPANPPGLPFRPGVRGPGDPQADEAAAPS